MFIIVARISVLQQQEVDKQKFNCLRNRRRRFQANE
jgi:hypothetical protein